MGITPMRVIPTRIRETQTLRNTWVGRKVTKANGVMIWYRKDGRLCLGGDVSCAVWAFTPIVSSKRYQGDRTLIIRLVILWDGTDRFLCTIVRIVVIGIVYIWTVDRRAPAEPERMNMGYVEIPTRVVPASREALEKFSATNLKEYAKDICGKRARNKVEAIDLLVVSGRATLCASLGN